MDRNLKNSLVVEQGTVKSRYDSARRIISGLCTKNIARNTVLLPIWIEESDCFWYERETEQGREYRIVDAHTAENRLAFRHDKLAYALQTFVEQPVDAANLPMAHVQMRFVDKDEGDRPRSVDVIFLSSGRHFVFETKVNKLTELYVPDIEGVGSPDGRWCVFSQNANLWLRDTKDGVERQLTQDGQDDFVYGAVGAAWGGASAPGTLQVLWSKDSKKIFTVQRDTRWVENLPVVRHVPDGGAVRPTVEHIKVAYPGDKYIETLKLSIIDIITGDIQAIDYPQIPTTRNGYGLFDAGLGWWAEDCSTVYFVDMARDYKSVRVVAANAQTGTAHIVLEECIDAPINLMSNGDQYPALLALPKTSELLWYSERTGWGHYYLYDLLTGNLKSVVTSGDWLVRNPIAFDPRRRELFVQTGSRTRDRDPYYRDIIRVHIDTGEMTEIVSSDHEYFAATQKDLGTNLLGTLGRDVRKACAISSSCNYIVATRSRANDIPVTLLFDREGCEKCVVENADLSSLPSGWQWPEPVKLKAADEETDIYGLVYRPSTFSPNQSYPVIAHRFGSPEMPWVPKGSFLNGPILDWPYMDAAALAELGFIVVQIDGRGGPSRNKAFLMESYGWIPSSSKLEDYITGIEQLAERFPYMDLNRVGITNPYSGGASAVQALLEFPEFFKVGVSVNFDDSRLMSGQMMGERYEGDSAAKYAQRYYENHVEKLQGKLLLMQGMLDFCSAPAGVFRLIDALQRAHKDFDMVMLPNVGHDPCSYFIRRSWDYLVAHLRQEEPPGHFELTTVFGGEIDREKEK